MVRSSRLSMSSPCSESRLDFLQPRIRSPARNIRPSDGGPIWTLESSKFRRRDSVEFETDISAQAEYVISQEDLYYHGESCSSSSRHQLRAQSLVDAAGNGCLCCLLRLRAVRAIQRYVDVSETFEGFEISEIQCYGEGQFVAGQGRHDADGVKDFPKVYFDVFTLPGKSSVLVV
jgi:hypothetical protein